MLDKIREEFKKIKIDTTEKLNEIRVQFLGKCGLITEAMKKIKDIPAEQKKAYGEKVNELKNEITEVLSDAEKRLREAKIQSTIDAMPIIDLTIPNADESGSCHPITVVAHEIAEIFKSMGFTVEDGNEIETEYNNFEAVNIPKEHPARDMQDSFYINENVLVRTQTSPVQVRTLLEAAGKPVKIVCPGKVYRRDDDDATHSHQFMQFEGLVVDKNITMSDLKGTLSLLMKKMFGENRSIRFKPSYFPFTEPSVEVDVSCFKCGGKGCPMCKHTGWIEVLGAGMVHPNVLKGAGYDPEVYRGFAFGVGIERVTMLRHNIDDIRNFYTNDYRFLKQFEGER